MAIIRKAPKRVAVIVANKNSVEPNIKELTALGMQISNIALETVGFFMFDALSPAEFAGKKVIVFHGTDDNRIPQQTGVAIELYGNRIGAIFCCYPKQMQRVLNDNRVQWTDINRPLLIRMKEMESKLIFTVIAEGE